MVGPSAGLAQIAPKKTPRAGERSLALLSTSLNLYVLHALSERPMRLADLRQATGLPAQTTLRGHLGSLEEIGAVEKRSTELMPYAVENALTPLGEELIRVADSLAAWLQRAPSGPIALDSKAARGIVKAFVDGWSSSIVGALAVRPMSLTELDREISEFSYPALERRLSSLRMAGLVEPQPARGSGTPYALTDWARRAARPLVAAVRCERVHMRDQAPLVAEADVERGLLLAAPLVDMTDSSSSGTCYLQVEAAEDLEKETGVRVDVEAGRVVAWEPRLGDGSASYASGTTTGWLAAIEEGAVEDLRFGGDKELAENLVRGIHVTLMKS